MTRVLVILVALAVASFAVASVAGATERPRSVPILRFECALQDNARMDPILNTSGQDSHLHQFFGSTKVEANSTGWSLRRETPSGSTSCMKDWETGASWAPAVYDGSGQIRISRMVWYFRYRGQGERLITPPTGLELIGREDKGDVAWGCAPQNTVLEDPPQSCAPGRILKLAIAFPNCLHDPPGPRKPQVVWNGGRNVSYVEEDRPCPGGYKALPEERLVIHYENTDGIQPPVRVSAENGEQRLASNYAHADIMHGEQYDAFDLAITRCLREAPNSNVPPPGCVDRDPAE